MNDQSAMQLALNKARQFEGMTAPNPPVGAVILDQDGKVMATGAHAGVGSPHAEVCALSDLKNLKISHSIPTSLIVTLEPCNHIGRTPPCTEALLETGIKRIVIGAKDPNPKVNGGGAIRLRQEGLEVIEGVLQAECENLIRTFKHYVTNGLPWVTLKRVLDQKGSMIPPQGQKTFSSLESLHYAHTLRKRADALLTGSGTVLADWPEFTVRHLSDHLKNKQKKRFLVVLDRRNRVPEHWIKEREAAGLRVRRAKQVGEALQFLGEQNCLEVLVEAGPQLSSVILEKNIWNQDVLIVQGAHKNDPDIVKETINIHWRRWHD
jgi:diaminohydroxyphosphoribosylaminopyrimidine deaminase / 5-amino-6-(5-phosphoribosylamino)uracil reductase